MKSDSVALNQPDGCTDAAMKVKYNRARCHMTASLKACLLCYSVEAHTELIKATTTASLSEYQLRGVCLTWGAGCFAARMELRHVPADLLGDNGFHMRIKDSSTLTYLSRRRFLQGSPTEIAIAC